MLFFKFIFDIDISKWSKNTKESINKKKIQKVLETVFDRTPKHTFSLHES